MVRSLIGITLVGILIFVGYLLYYLGAFKDVKVYMSEVPAQNLLLSDHFGPYHKIVPVIEKVEAWAKENNVPCTITFGQFIDDPNVVEHDRLRSRGGCVLTFPMDRPLPAEFKILPMEGGMYIQAEFEGSPAIGPYKVYPKIHDFAEQQRLVLETMTMETYEIFENNKMKTHYYFKVKAQ